MDIIYYINLDRRPDRNAEFLKEMDTHMPDYPKDQIIRIPGIIYDNDGPIANIYANSHIGCALSHIVAMERFIESCFDTCIIFEDDFEFTQSPDIIAELTMPFDLCMLSANEFKTEPTQYSFLNKALDAQMASGYIITKSFAPILLQNFKESVNELMRYNNMGQFDGRYCCDIHWKRLQPLYNWYAFNPKLGKQRKSYSDIERCEVNYEV